MICSVEASGASPKRTIGEFLLSSFKAQWRACRKQLRRCEKEASETAVHKLRISLRRLLSIVGLVAGMIPQKHLEAAERDLRKQLKAFAPLRDVHTQLNYLKKLGRGYPEANICRNSLKKLERRLAKRSRRKLGTFKVRRLDDRMMRIRKELRSLLDDAGEEKVSLTVMETPRSTFAGVMQRYRAIDPNDTSSIHRTRVAFKHYRYMLAALQPVVPRLAKGQLKSMRDYQTRMGNIQDLEVLLTHIEEFQRQSHLVTAGWDQLRAELARRRAAFVVRYMASADELFKFEPLPFTNRLRRRT